MFNSLLFWCVLSRFYCPLLAEHDAVLQEVQYGKTAILKCHSNDADHNFLFWKLKSDDIVGPGTNYDKYKYDYEVLSGNLTIRAVTLSEDGIYYCFSEGVKTNDYNVRPVRMVVRKDWEEVWENDSSVNIFRVIVALGSLITILGGAYLVYRIWKNRFRNPSYLEVSDEEDSAEEIFTAPSTSRGRGNIVIDRSGASENSGISTDFVSILENADDDK